MDLDKFYINIGMYFGQKAVFLNIKTCCESVLWVNCPRSQLRARDSMRGSGSGSSVNG